MPRTRDSVLVDLADHPEAHRHETFAELSGCCTVTAPDGAVPVIDLALLEAHSRLPDLPKNGGVICDVRSGPCSCGAWH